MERVYLGILLSYFLGLFLLVLFDIYRGKKDVQKKTKHKRGRYNSPFNQNNRKASK